MVQMYKEEEAMETHDLDRHIIMIVIVDMLISNNLLIQHTGRE